MNLHNRFELEAVVVTAKLGLDLLRLLADLACLGDALLLGGGPSRGLDRGLSRRHGLTNGVLMRSRSFTRDADL